MGKSEVIKPGRPEEYNSPEQGKIVMRALAEDLRAGAITTMSSHGYWLGYNNL